MAWSPASDVGERDALIPAAKNVLRKFSYGKGLGDTDAYTAEFGVALRQWQVNVNYQILFKGRPGPGVNTDGVFDWAVKKQFGILPEDQAPEAKPWVITVAGHMGAWDTGPAYLTAMALGHAVRVQGVGYNNTALPFDNQSGYAELNRIVMEWLPRDVPWAIASHSQGCIVTSDYLERVVLPGKARGEAPYVNFRGGVHFANPRRPYGVSAPWVADPPDIDTEGLDPVCLTAEIPGMAEVARHGDLYAEKRRDEAGEHKSAVYLAAARGRFTGKDSLAEQIGEIVTDIGPEMFAVFQAITGGIQFLFDMSSHDVFDLGPCVNHLKSVLL